jgi:hypothetical protein
VKFRESSFPFPVPVCLHLFVNVLREDEALCQGVSQIVNFFLLNSSQAGEHAESFSTSHFPDNPVELRAVAQVTMHLLYFIPNTV